MKRISIILCLVLTVIGITSCGKTTKGKMSNEWKVVSMEQVETFVNSNGDKHISKLSANDNTITETDEYHPASGPQTSDSETGVMNTNEWIINKDGTWSWVIDGTYTTFNGTRQQLLEQGGTWSFLDRTKGDDFKKNERILFNVLTANLWDIVTENGVVVDDYSDKLIYTTGKNTMIYTVLESKKDQLELELDAKNVSGQSSGMNNYSNENSTYRKIILEGK